MSLVFCLPFAATIVDKSEQASGPAQNLLRDHPGRMWRSASLTGAFVTVQLDGSPWDTVALVRSNLRAADTIRIRAGANSSVVAGSSAPLDMTINGWTGTAPLEKPISFLTLGNAVTHPFVRIDITSNGNPEGYVEASRLVIGKRVEHDGVNIGAERTHMSGDEKSDVRGYTTVQEYRSRRSWKFSVGPLKAATFYDVWDRFLYTVKQSRGFLFIEDTASPWCQSEAAFVRNQIDVKTVNVSSDFAKLDMTLLEL